MIICSERGEQIPEVCPKCKYNEKEEKFQRVYLRQEISSCAEVPERLKTGKEVIDWLEENDGWPNITDGEWLGAVVTFPKDEEEEKKEFNDV
jgi:hypothetical protein